MAVNLSPIGGVAGQFFDNNGDPLVGGKLYTYSAGTTTPSPTYTSASGSTPNSNPIILNGGGRVPAEIWLTDGFQYKFVLYSSTDQLIGSWDNIVGINSNFVNFTNQQEIQTATAGQTVFTLTTMQYEPGTNSLSVFVDGVNQYGPGAQYAYVETDVTTVTFVSGLHVGASVKFTTSQINSAAATSADQVSYTPAGTGAVPTNVQAKLRETVSVKDFGAVGDGVTDDTAAVQAAVNYCIANDLNLVVDGQCLLTASVNIDRQVDGAAFDNYFIITAVTGSGFIVNTAIPMFSSSIPYTTAPVTQLIKFDNLIFSSTDNSLDAYVLDNGKFLRTRFDFCSFQKIRLLNATSSHTQSIYLNGCNARRFIGVFFNSTVYTYDFKMVNCLVEAGVTCLRLVNPVGCAVTASCIEGMSGTAIIYDAAQALSISGNYFEANGLDIDGTDGGTAASNSYGVQLTGNYFSNSTATYTVKWYAVLGSISAGNWHTGNMHDFTSPVKEIVVYDVAQGSVSNSDTMLTITGGYSVDVPVTLSGGTTSPSANLRVNVDADIVTINTPTITVTSNTTAATLATLPTYLRPTVQQIVFARVIDNGATVLGLFIVDPTGVITLAVGADGGAFTNSGTKGIAVNTLTYSLN